MSPERTPIHNSNIRESMARYDEIMQRNQAEQAAEQAEHMAMLEQAHAENETFDARRKHAADIEARAKSPEVRALNDKAQLEIFGSQGGTWVDPKSGKVIADKDHPLKGKIETIRESGLFGFHVSGEFANTAEEKNFNYGAYDEKAQENENAAQKYEAQVHELLDAGYELSQVKLIMDMREERARTRPAQEAQLRQVNEQGQLNYERKVADVQAKNQRILEDARRDNQRMIADARRENQAKIAKFAELEMAKGMSHEEATESARARLSASGKLISELPLNTKPKLLEEPKPFKVRRLQSEGKIDKRVLDLIKDKGIFSVEEYRQATGQSGKATAKKPKAGKNGQAKTEAEQKANEVAAAREAVQEAGEGVSQDDQKPSPEGDGSEIAKAENELEEYLQGLSDEEAAQFQAMWENLDQLPKGAVISGRELGKGQKAAFTQEFLDRMVALGRLESNGTARNPLKNTYTVPGTPEVPAAHRPKPGNGKKPEAAATDSEAAPEDGSYVEDHIQGLSDADTEKLAFWLGSDEVYGKLNPGQGFKVKTMLAYLHNDGWNITYEQLDELLSKFSGTDSGIEFVPYTDDEGNKYYGRPNTKPGVTRTMPEVSNSSNDADDKRPKPGTGNRPKPGQPTGDALDSSDTRSKRPTPGSRAPKAVPESSLKVTDDLEAAEPEFFGTLSEAKKAELTKVASKFDELITPGTVVSVYSLYNTLKRNKIVKELEFGDLLDYFLIHEKRGDLMPVGNGFDQTFARLNESQKQFRATASERHEKLAADRQAKEASATTPAVRRKAERNGTEEARDKKRLGRLRRLGSKAVAKTSEQEPATTDAKAKATNDAIQTNERKAHEHEEAKAKKPKRLRRLGAAAVRGSVEWFKNLDLEEGRRRRLITNQAFKNGAKLYVEAARKGYKKVVAASERRQTARFGQLTDDGKPEGHHELMDELTTSGHRG